MTEIAHYISGKPVGGTSGRSQNVWNPATGQSDTAVALASTEEVDRAVAAAKAAWPDWSATPALRRARILDRFKAILWDRTDALAEAISREHGKTTTTHLARSPVASRSSSSRSARPCI